MRTEYSEINKLSNSVKIYEAVEMLAKSLGIKDRGLKVFMESLAKHQNKMVIKYDSVDRPVAVATGFRIDESLYLSNIGIKPDYRNMGLGQEMLMLLYDELKGGYLTFRSTNPRMYYLARSFLRELRLPDAVAPVDRGYSDAEFGQIAALFKHMRTLSKRTKWKDFDLVEGIVRNAYVQLDELHFPDEDIAGMQQLNPTFGKGDAMIFMAELMGEC